MRGISRLVLASSENLVFVNEAMLLTNLEVGRMNSPKRITSDSTAGFPPLQRPKPEIADRGTVRLGSSCITAGFPPLSR